MKRYILLFGMVTSSLFGSMTLNEFEEAFETAYKGGQFESVLETRHPKANGKFELELQKSQEERKRALLAITHSNLDETLSKRIQRIAAFRLTSLQVESLKYIDSLKAMPLNSSNSPLENRLIAIDAEYECKNFYIDMLFSQGKLSLVDKKGMKVFFKIEKMQKMLNAANASHEHAIARLVEEADLILGPYQAYQDDLQALETQPSTA